MEEKDEEAEIARLVAENKVLSNEKKRALSEIVVWRVKYKELETRLLELEKRLCQSCQKHRYNARVGRKDKIGQDILDVATDSTLFNMKNHTVDHDQATRAVEGAADLSASGMSSNIKRRIAAWKKYKEKKNEPTCLVSAEKVSFATISFETIVPPPPLASERFHPKTLEGSMPSIDISCKSFAHKDEFRKGPSCRTKSSCGGQVKKQYNKFLEYWLPERTIAPSTPGASRPSFFGVNICDKNYGRDTTQHNVYSLEVPSNDAVHGTFENVLAPNLVKDKLDSNEKMKTGLSDYSDGEDVGYEENFSSLLNPKRKRASNIVASDSESDNNDEAPLCKVKMNSPLGVEANSVTVSDSMEISRKTAGRRRLVKLSNCDEDRNEEDVSESEGDSLGGFIVDAYDTSDSNDASCDNDVSDGNHTSNDNAKSGDSQDGDSDVDYGEIISQFRRKRGGNMKWQFEADMLAAFGKDFEPCMKAVCALYRRQTSDEQECKGSIHLNQRGFSLRDAHRASVLAQFLTDGDAEGDLKKSVEELREYDPDGPELCRILATHYSKQLFAIYQNKEDPFFVPDK